MYRPIVSTCFTPSRQAALHAVGSGHGRHGPHLDNLSARSVPIHGQARRDTVPLTDVLQARHGGTCGQLETVGFVCVDLGEEP